MLNRSLLILIDWPDHGDSCVDDGDGDGSADGDGLVFAFCRDSILDRLAM